MAFDPGKVVTVMWPELAGILALFAVKSGAKYIDESYGLTKLFRKTEHYVDSTAVAVPLYLIATGSKATEESKAVLFAMTGVVGQRIANKAYSKIPVTKSVKNRRLAEKQGGGTKQLTEAERRLLEAATLEALAKGQTPSRALALSI
ncbi:hypothetical protein ES703_88934 [subsurface metagenome]